MKTKIALGKPLKKYISISVSGKAWPQLSDSLDCNVYSFVSISLNDSINNSTKWEIEL